MFERDAEMRERELAGEFLYFSADGVEGGGVAGTGGGAIEPGGDEFHVLFLEAAGGEGGGADADAGGFHGFAGVVGHHVFVDDDAGGLKPEFDGGAGEVGVFAAEVDEHEVVVGAAGDEAVAAIEEFVGEGLGVFDDLAGVGFELGFEGFTEGDGLGGDDVHEGTALEAGEDGGVDFFSPVGLAHGHAAARAAEGFVGGGGDEVGEGDGGGVVAGGDKAGDVGDIGHEEGTDFFGDFGEGGPIPGAGVGAGTGDDEFGFVFEGDFADIGHVDAFGLLVEDVVDGFEPFAGHVDVLAVGEVAAVVEVEAHDGVAGGEGGEEDGLVGL